MDKPIDKLISIRYIGNNTKEITYTNISKPIFELNNNINSFCKDFKVPFNIKRIPSTKPQYIFQPDELFNEFKETDDEEYDPRHPNDYEKVRN
jgi:hypothetical protein